MGSVSALSAEGYTTTLCAMVGKGGGRAPPPPYQPGLIFPSRWNVRQQKWPLPLSAFDCDEINCSCSVKVGQPPMKANVQCTVQ